VAIGEHELIIRFHPEGAITIEGHWLLKDERGVIIDRSIEHADRNSWSIPKILGKNISKCEVKDDRHLVIFFGGLELQIEDSSDQYESFTVEHAGLKLYV
jgi:hypothetical protein